MKNSLECKDPLHTHNDNLTYPRLNSIFEHKLALTKYWYQFWCPRSRDYVWNIANLCVQCGKPLKNDGGITEQRWLHKKCAIILRLRALK